MSEMTLPETLTMDPSLLLPLVVVVSYDVPGVELLLELLPPFRKGRGRRDAQCFEPRPDGRIPHAVEVVALPRRDSAAVEEGVRVFDVLRVHAMVEERRIRLK